MPNLDRVMSCHMRATQTGTATRHMTHTAIACHGDNNAFRGLCMSRVHKLNALSDAAAVLAQCGARAHAKLMYMQQESNDGMPGLPCQHWRPLDPARCKHALFVSTRSTPTSLPYSPTFPEDENDNCEQT